ncbi:hypothetical protein AAMO2058_001368500 [Amorphochlora amoebiformis]
MKTPKTYLTILQVEHCACLAEPIFLFEVPKEDMSNVYELDWATGIERERASQAHKRLYLTLVGTDLLRLFEYAGVLLSIRCLGEEYRWAPSCEGRVTEAGFRYSGRCSAPRYILKFGYGRRTFLEHCFLA